MKVKMNPKQNHPKKKVNHPKPIPLPELKKELKTSFETNKSHFLTFLQKVQEKMNTQEPNSTLDEDLHRSIIFQNIRKMIEEGDKLLAMKRETTPFQTLYLQFDDEPHFQKIVRNHRICSDGQQRDDAFEYITFLLKDHQESLQKLLQEESKFFTFQFEKRIDPMSSFQLRQIQNEYPEFYDSMFFFHHRSFTPISQLLFSATLKVDSF